MVRDSSVFPRDMREQLPVVERGEGVFLHDAAGRSWLDGSGGAAVSCLGHSDAKVRAAIAAQMERVPFAHTGFFTSEPAELLAARLAALAPAAAGEKRLGRVWFVSGGSEAMESAIKLARQYFLDRGEPGRHRVIARRQSYHGSTLGALAAGGNAIRRAVYGPLLVETSHIAPCFAFRGQQAGESPEQYGERVAGELEAEILRLGPEQVMAFVAETVVGATAGAVAPVPGYFRHIRSICDRYGVLLILDEVMCGMGRTGTLFACEQEDIVPDMIAIAKGLGAGYQPLGALMCNEHIYRTVEDGAGFFQHGHTYMGHPMACAAGLAVVSRLVDDGLVARSARMGDVLADRLNRQFAQHPHVGDIRGRGLFRALEFVADRQTLQPFDPGLGLHRRIRRCAMEAGLVCYPGGGTVDGKSGDHVLLAPAFIIQEDEIDLLVERLARAVGQALVEVQQAS